MNINNKILVCVFTLATIMCGCKKENEEQCQSVPSPKSLSGYEYITSPHVEGITFNPNNPNEIAYYELVNWGTQNLVVYNLATKEKRVLHTAFTFMDNPQWGSTGWILFNTAFDATTGNYTIYKIRPDGTEKEIVVSEKAFSPVFNPSGTSFIYQSGLSPVEAKIITMDLDGNIISQCITQNTGIRPIAWYSESKALIIENGGRISIFDLDDCSSEIIAEKESEAGYIGGIVMPPSTLIWHSSESGMYKTDLVTRVKTSIKSSCNSIRYRPTAYSTQSNMIAVSRVTLTTPDTIKLYENFDILFIKPDGTCEKVIDLGL